MIRGLIYGVHNIFLLIYIILIARCLLSFIPNLNWNKQPFKFIRFSADLYLDLFRNLIPPIGMLDISPIIGFVVLSIVYQLVMFLLHLLV